MAFIVVTAPRSLRTHPLPAPPRRARPRPPVCVAPPPRRPSLPPVPPPPPSSPRPSSASSSLTTLSTLASPPPAPSPSPAPPISPSPPAPSPPSPSAIAYVWPRALLLAVAAIWGTNFPTVKLLHTDPAPLPVATAALARFTLASLAMLPFVPVELARAPIPKAFLPSTMAIGTAVFIGYYAQSISLTTTDASTSAFICALSVVIVPLLSRAARALRLLPPAPSRSALAVWGAPCLALLGVALLEGGGSPPTAGDAWALVQAAAFALGFVLNERSASAFPQLVFSQSALQLTIVAALSFVWALVDASAPAHALVMPSISDAFVEPVNALVIVYTGLFTTALTVWLENVVLKHVSASELVVLLSTEPFWAAAFSAVVLGERMGPQAIIGGVIILAACVVNQLGSFDPHAMVKDKKR